MVGIIARERPRENHQREVAPQHVDRRHDALEFSVRAGNRIVHVNLAEDRRMERQPRAHRPQRAHRRQQRHVAFQPEFDEGAPEPAEEIFPRQLGPAPKQIIEKHESADEHRAFLRKHPPKRGDPHARQPRRFAPARGVRRAQVAPPAQQDGQRRQQVRAPNDIRHRFHVHRMDGEQRRRQRRHRHPPGQSPRNHQHQTDIGPVQKKIHHMVAQRIRRLLAAAQHRVIEQVAQRRQWAVEVALKGRPPIIARQNQVEVFSVHHGDARIAG